MAREGLPRRLVRRARRELPLLGEAAGRVEPAIWARARHKASISGNGARLRVVRPHEGQGRTESKEAGNAARKWHPQKRCPHLAGGTHRLRDAFIALDTAKVYPDGVTYWDKLRSVGVFTCAGLGSGLTSTCGAR